MEQELTIYMKSGNRLCLRGVKRTTITQLVMEWEKIGAIATRGTPATMSLLSFEGTADNACHCLRLSEIEAISY